LENSVQKVDSVQTKALELSENAGLVDVVKKTIFPTGTKEEMQLFFYQCARSGVHPLDRKIIPIKFKDGEDDAGNKTFKMSFISTIDHARSKAGETGVYDGQDEPEFSNETIDQPYKKITGWEGKRPIYEDAIAVVPDTCIVRVHRKDVSRPFVGVARWVEFYPGDKKGQQYIKMPTIMLAKCAEMQAMRKAFPDALHNLYSEEEMLHVIENMADTTSTGDAGSKPSISENDVSFSDGNSENPTEEQMASLKLISTKQAGLLRGECKKQKIKPETIATYCKVKNVNWLTWQKSDPKCFEKILKTVQEKPDFFIKLEADYQNAKEATHNNAPTAPAAPSVMGSDEFVALAISTAKSVGLAQDKAELQMDMEFNFKTFADVPADKQSMVIDWLTSVDTAPGA
jgi:phage recombination protein Bet